MADQYPAAGDKPLNFSKSGRIARFLDGPIRIPVTLRSPATLERTSNLAMPVLRGMRRKQRGGWRLLFKIYLSVFQVLSRLMRLPVRGTLLYEWPNGQNRIDVDLTNLQYLYLPLTGESHVYEPRITALLNYISPKLSTVYDIGSNWGYYALLLATNPSFHGRIHAFEIAPKTYRDLVHISGALAPRTDVQMNCHQVGLSDHAGRARVKHHAFSGMTMIVPEDETSGDLLPVVTVDELALAPPDLMKIDVEGHEAAVLKGAQQTLAQHLPTVILENHFDSDYDRMLEPLRILAELGYLLFHPAWELDTPGGPAYANELQPGKVQEQILCLFEISPETRLLTSGAPDVIAIHPSRLHSLFATESE